jgi:thiol-disulfide isomerase/thioredoxin
MGLWGRSSVAIRCSDGDRPALVRRGASTDMDREGAGENTGGESGTADDSAARSGADGPPTQVPVTVYSREYCHLCDEAVETLEAAAAAVDVPVTITEVDVDADPDLRAEYGDRVPYVLVDDRPAFKFRVDPDEARRRFREAGE